MRGLLAVIGRSPVQPLAPVFRVADFTRWVIDHDEFHSMSQRRLSALISEWCEVHGAAIPSDAMYQDDLAMDVVGFTKWVGDLGYSNELSIHNLRDLTTYYCVLVGHCRRPSMVDSYLIRALLPGGWESYRGKQRPVGDKIARPTLYRITRSSRLAA